MFRTGTVPQAHTSKASSRRLTDTDGAVEGRDRMRATGLRGTTPASRWHVLVLPSSGQTKHYRGTFFPFLAYVYAWFKLADVMAGRWEESIVHACGQRPSPPLR